MPPGTPELYAVSSGEWVVKVIHWFLDLIPALGLFVKNFVGLLIGLSFALSIFLFIGIIYVVERLKIIRKKEDEKLESKVEPAWKELAPGEAAVAHHWENAERLITSENQSDWKQAIIEADILLDDLLTKMGYRGESVGEKLKRVEKGDMKNLDDAWEAHKIRNQIAHEPGFMLDHHLAKRVLHHYRKVFEEFYYI